MNISDLKEYLEIFKIFFIFIKNPKEIISFIKRNRGWKFIVQIVIYFILCTTIFILLINYFNSAQFVTKWVPLIIILQVFIYIPLCIFTISFRNIKSINNLIEIFKIAIVEALIVISTLMYISITIYLLFLFTELYVFYYVYIVFSILLTVYSCVFFPLKISDYKKVISIFLTLICYLGINFFSTTLLARKSTNSNSFILDLIYYESIKKTYEIIKYTEYYISHQNIITDLESEYYNDGNLDKLNLLNNQIDLLLLKKDDIEKYNNEIIFKRNKKELHTLIEIIELEEKIKREINNYTYISPEYKKALKQNEDRLKMLSAKIENIKVKYSNEYLQIEDEILSITTELNEISTSLKITHFIQKQVDINHQALKEINRCNILIEEKVKLLNEQTKNTMDYWEKRSRFLF